MATRRYELNDGRSERIRDYIPAANKGPPAIGLSASSMVYKERHLVGCFFNKLGHFHNVVARYDKPAGSISFSLPVFSSYVK